VTGDEVTTESFDGDVIVIEGGVVSGPGGGGFTTTLRATEWTRPPPVPVIVAV
jgi:hypothetical protein